MDEDESNIKYEITRKHFEEGLAGRNMLQGTPSAATAQSLPAGLATRSTTCQRPVVAGLLS